MEGVIHDLHRFLRTAMLSTYAGDGKEAISQRPGFTELEYAEGRFSYRDSFCGFYTSAGQEVVRLDGHPFWTQLYGGGMTPPHRDDEAFALRTFRFLKRALSQKPEAFQPRGPRQMTDDAWEYRCEWKGDITEFHGSERILFREEEAFAHEFLGGLIRSR
jgi:hypothetical protein